MGRNIISLFIAHLLFVNLLFAQATEYEQLAQSYYITSASIYISHRSQKFYTERFNQFHKSYSPEATYASFKLADIMVNDKGAKKESEKLYMNQIKEGLSIQDLKNILRWLNSPLGKKINQLQKQHILKTSDIDFFHEQIESSGNPLNQERRELFWQMERVFQRTNMIVQITRSYYQFIRKIFYSAKNRVILKQREEEKLKGIVWEHIDRQYTIRRQFALRECSNDELREYIHFLNSKSGKRMIEVNQKIIMAEALPKRVPIPIKQSELPLISKSINKELPKMYGDNIRLELSVVKKGALVYHYTLLNPPKSKLELKRLKENLHDTWEENICRSETMAYYPFSGVSLLHHYFDENKQLIFEINVTPQTCGL